ncbi:MAG: HAMP domain-containing sensor histidine kinase [Planctomycetota bacterium]
MSNWSIARRSTVWFGGLLMVLLLGLVGSSYLMLERYMASQLDEEVEDLGLAASGQLVGATREEAASVLELLVEEGRDLGIGFVLQRGDGELRSGRDELALGRPADVEARVWRSGSFAVENGGTLLLGIDGETRMEELSTLPRSMGLIAAVFAAIAAVASWWFGRRMAAMLGDVADAVDPGGAHPPRGAPREIARLVDAINHGFSQAEAAQSRSKLLISGAAHALRSPIQALLSQAQSTLRKERSVARYRDTLEGQELELTEFARSVDNLVALCAAGDHPPAPEAFDLMGELRLRLQPDEDRAARVGVELVLGGPDSLLVEAEREALVLAVRNIVSNALSVSAPRQRVDVRGESDGERVEITVDDEGPGVPLDDRERVFEAMRRGSNAGRSVDARARYGLGLALVRRAMDDHEGRAWIEESPAGGARARLSFPSIAPSAVHAEAQATIADPGAQPRAGPPPALTGAELLSAAWEHGCRRPESG